ncbi:MAG: TIGR03013 family PEP-CTERM/XrtA system glycosyltransferase [Gammaproteobacteria bacterium]|nr:TIGR03013 family PEP-CTERM/XrtA system glycosyltransferase [Gammaproteobacteria bacterium]
MIRVFSHYIPIKVLLLLLVETAILVSAVYLGGSLRFAGDQAGFSDALAPIWPKSLVFTSLILLAMSAVGLYHGDFREGLRGILLQLVLAFLLGAGILGLIFYLVPSFYLGRGVFGLAFLIAFLGLLLTRAILFKWTNLGTFKPRILVLGTGTRAADVEKGAQSNLHAGNIDIVGYLPLLATQHDVCSSRVLPAQGSILSVAKHYGVNEIVIAVRDWRGGGLPVQELLECKLSGVKITELSTFFERECGQVQLDSLNTSWMVFGEGFRQGVLRNAIKRVFDLVASSVLFLATLPVMLITALAILLEDGRPVLYRQERVGQSGQIFTIYKFRSMRQDAEKDGSPRWAKADDDRITRVGRIIRKLRIDELPQIINVFKGEMSFIGPRPERPYFVEKLAAQIPYFNARHSIKPGITGWAQVRYAYGASLADAVEKLQYDLYYVKNHTLFLDIMILLETIRVVLRGKGAR